MIKGFSFGGWMVRCFIIMKLQLAHIISLNVNKNFLKRQFNYFHIVHFLNATDFFYKYQLF